MTNDLLGHELPPGGDSRAFLRMNTISKEFRTRRTRQRVIDRIDVAVNEGEFVTLIGPSGCGKTTLLNLVAGLLRPDTGTIRLDGAEITGPRGDVGVVFQHHVLLPWMTAYENVRFALDCTMKHASVAERERRALQSLAMVQLDAARDKKPGQLSGGMQQRVGLARAFAIQPKLLLLDEPFGALDALTRVTLQDQLLQIWEASRPTVVMVTHDVDEAILLSDRLIVMSPGPSSVIRKDLRISFPRPRNKEALMHDPAYYAMRAELLTSLMRELVA